MDHSQQHQSGSGGLHLTDSSVVDQAKQIIRELEKQIPSKAKLIEPERQ